MSRNVRQNPPATPVKVTKRRLSDSSSSLDLSDEGGYSGVEDISDSDEDDEEDVDAAEAEHILSDELQDVAPSSPRPVEEDEQGDDEEEDDDEDDDDDDGDAEDSDTWEGLASEDDDDDDVGVHVPVPETTAVQRRVRFDVPDSDGDSTETDDDLDHYNFFPDLFVDKNTLDPSFRREIEHDPFPDDSSSSDAFWDNYGVGEDYTTFIKENASDFEALMRAMEQDDSTPIDTTMQSELSTALSTPAVSPEKDDDSLAGYQSDGDTTDEEVPPEKPIRRKGRREAVDEDSDSGGVKLIKPRRGQPRVGRFNLDKSCKKPIAILNPRTGKMMIFTHQSMKKGFDLSPEQFNFQYFDQAQSSPILSNPGNIMMSGMISSSTFGDFMNTHTVGPAEAWYAQGMESGAIEEASESDDQVVDDEEKNLKLEDFITLDDHSDSSDDEKLVVNDEDDIFCTPGRPTTSSSDVTALLGHFEHNPDIVGAFRRDQANHQLISRSKVSRESLAFSGQYMEGTLRGIKDGHIPTTNIPITPARKQKRMTELASSPLSGLTQKRKASSSEHNPGHKRQRSVPDVQPLYI
ncbi:hypothetical protein GGR56DRAFT_616665 [Xylariaceae sp. FL0804]|nr:hypothetical protein GGR56DRAFT_616665 [Xylariaceae sp. FL0804]